ncbi:hypothetical protein BH10PLA1_BH10PLA1_15560 [soil metagenome]
MPDFSYDPPLPPGPVEGFIQTIRLIDAGKQIGLAKWYVPGDGHDGVAQLLELATTLPVRRTGQGKRLMSATLDEIRKFFRARKFPTRRVWMNVNQKDHVIGRAFLTGAGFHHVGTIASLLKGQDALIYVLSLD